MEKRLFTAIATLTGTVIGAGFLGIPYVIAKTGFFIGLFWMALLCLVMMFINLILGEIVLSTKTMHHIPGYAAKYLGKKTKIFVFITSIIGFYAALIAYLLGEGESFSYLFTGTTEYVLLAGILFWVLMAVFTFKGIKSFKKLEPIGVLGIFIITIIFGVVFFNQIDYSNLTYNNPGLFFLPFGVILFAFMGMSSVPEMKRIVIKKTKLLKKAIIIGSWIPFIVYLLFAMVVLGLYGAEITQVASISLGTLVILLGIFTMFTSFIALTLALQDTYRFDFNFSARKAWLYTIIVPLILFILISVFDLAGFVKVLSIGGSISGGLISIALLLVHERIKKQDIQKKLEREPEFKVRLPLIVKIIFIIMFVAGIVYEFLPF